MAPVVLTTTPTEDISQPQETAPLLAWRPCKVNLLASSPIFLQTRKLGSRHSGPWAEPITRAGSSKQRLVTVGDSGMRDSAIAFVNTLDDPYPPQWGGGGGTLSPGMLFKQPSMTKRSIRCTCFRMENQTETAMEAIGAAMTITPQQTITRIRIKIVMSH